MHVCIIYCHLHHENWISMKFKTIRYVVWFVHHCILTSRAEPGTEREANKSLLGESPATFSRPKSWTLKGQYCEHCEFWNEHFFCHGNSYFPSRFICIHSSYRQEFVFIQTTRSCFGRETTSILSGTVWTLSGYNSQASQGYCRVCGDHC